MSVHLIVPHFPPHSPWGIIPPLTSYMMVPFTSPHCLWNLIILSRNIINVYGHVADHSDQLFWAEATYLKNDALTTITSRHCLSKDNASPSHPHRTLVMLLSMPLELVHGLIPPTHIQQKFSSLPLQPSIYLTLSQHLLPGKSKSPSPRMWHLRLTHPSSPSHPQICLS